METPVHHQMMVLLVEDDPLTRKMMTSILAQADYRFEVATNGRECLEVLKNCKPDVILMDVKMPEIDGIGTCRKIKADAELATIPVVFITGCTDDKTLEAAFEAGGRDFIRKPISRIELLSRLKLMKDLHETQRRQMESVKLKSVLETAGGVCHKLNQPLQYVLGATQILMMDLSKDHRLFPQLDGIREKIEQMGDITRKLAEITRYRTKAHAGGQHILDIDDSTGHKIDNSGGD